MTRLKLPMRFRTEAHAYAAIEAASLYPSGAKVAKGDQGRWFIVIDTDQPEVKLRFLRNHMLGQDWTLESAPT